MNKGRHERGRVGKWFTLQRKWPLSADLHLHGMKWVEVLVSGLSNSPSKDIPSTNLRICENNFNNVTSFASWSFNIPSASTSLIMSWSSASVGFCPRDLITVPSSFVVIVPSPSLSKSEKASLNSASQSWWGTMLINNILKCHNERMHCQIYVI